MPRTCRACRHEKRNEIDEALTRGDPNRRIAAQFGASEAAIRRHRAHVAAVVSRRREGAEMLSAERLVQRLGKLEEQARTILDRAMRRGEHRTAVAALRELRGQVETLVALASAAALRRPAAREVVVVDVSAIGDDLTATVESLPPSDDEEPDVDPADDAALI